jgi:hypothetical protein
LLIKVGDKVSLFFSDNLVNPEGSAAEYLTVPKWAFNTDRGQETLLDLLLRDVPFLEKNYLKILDCSAA